MPPPAPPQIDRSERVRQALSASRSRFGRFNFDWFIKRFFASNALIAILVLALITLFLFREGVGFVRLNHNNLKLYRATGLEYADIIRDQLDAHRELTQQLNGIRTQQVRALLAHGHTLPRANEALAPLDEFTANVTDVAIEMQALLSELSEFAMATKQKAIVRADKIEERQMLLAARRAAEAAQVQIPEVDLEAEVQILRDAAQGYSPLADQAQEAMTELLRNVPELPIEEKQLTAFRKNAREYLDTFDVTQDRLANWDQNKPVPFYRGLTTFLFGRRWLTASFWQDWYGIVPLLVGSLMVSLIALSIAVPLSVAGAIYVNQIASHREQQLIKPAIEFIAAIPSVVLGFFGIVVLGQSLRVLSEQAWLAWLPFFPIQERLNAMTAGILLGLMAVPTIFTLAEDAINNVPVAFKEASFALGASRLQTIIRIIVPAALSGIVAAVLLGFGRVIGETMVVLLVAGNRIAIPDFSAGLGALFQPVHTMTGIIAQEMGEVAYGSIHYRALFMVAMVLFLIALLVNYSAQRISQKFKFTGV